MTTLKPITGKRRRDCTRCHGEAAHHVLVDGERTGLVACCWCARRIEAGALVVRGKQLVEPIRRKAKRTGES